MGRWREEDRDGIEREGEEREGGRVRGREQEKEGESAPHSRLVEWSSQPHTEYAVHSQHRLPNAG